MRKEEFKEKATNVYRTKRYIVCQRLEYICSEEENTTVISRDTYYIRTKARDKEYEREFFKRIKIDGKRLPSTSYVREYK